jgi:hypothetical protein
MRGFEIHLKDKNLQEICYGYLAPLRGFDFQRRHEGLFCLSRGQGRLSKPWEKLGSRLSRFILEAWEEKKLEDLTEETFIRFTPLQRAAVVKKARYLMHQDSLEWGLYAGGSRLYRLEQELNHYLKEHDALDIDGFIRFRLKGYEEYLLAVLSLAADEVLQDEEEKDYLALLQDYLQAHPVSAGCFHLLLFRDGAYNLLKGSEGLEILEGGREEGYEDSLIAHLLHLSPEKLVLHIEEGRLPGLSAEALGRIFKERLYICQGCSICRQGSGIV